jgi:hypothetical protein
MARECRIEYYFRAEELKRLLDANPDARGIIVSQEIRKEKPKGTDSFVNVARIRARVHKGPLGDETTSAKLMEGGDEPPPPPEEGIDGCPYPPGCTP